TTRSTAANIEPPSASRRTLAFCNTFGSGAPEIRAICLMGGPGAGMTPQRASAMPMARNAQHAPPMHRAFALLLVAGSAHALTLAEARSHARATEPRLRSALAELAARKSESRVPRAAWLPSVGATAQLIYGSSNNTTASYLGVAEIDLPRIGASPGVSSTNWT